MSNNKIAKAKRKRSWRSVYTRIQRSGQASCEPYCKSDSGGGRRRQPGERTGTNSGEQAEPQAIGGVLW